MKMNVRSNFKQIAREMKLKKSKLKKVFKDEINTTAFQARKAELDEVDSVFENPTPATKKSVLVKKANTSGLTAEVFVSDKKNQEQYLELQVEGGTRKPKRKTLIAPVGVRKNKYGNITRNKISKLLQNKEKYFAGKPAGKKWSDSPYGVWQRMGKNGRGKLRLLINFSDSQKYSKRFRFYQVGNDSVMKNLEKNIEKGLQKLFQEEME